MSSPQELLAPVLALDDERLVEWLGMLAREQPAEPRFPYPREFRSAADFLVAVVYQCRNDVPAERLGDGAVLAFQHFLGSGGFVPALVRKDRAEVASNLVYLVEALPCTERLAASAVDTLLSMLCTPVLRSFPNPAVNLHRRLLLALPGKLDVLRDPNFDVPRLLREDLSDQEYAAAAFAVCVRLNSSHAPQYLSTVLATLQGGVAAMGSLFADLVLAMNRHPIEAESVFLEVLRSGDSGLKEAFREELEALAQPSVIDVWQSVTERDPTTTLTPIHVANGLATKISRQLAIEQKERLALDRGDPKQNDIEFTYGTEIARKLLGLWQTGSNDGQVCTELAGIVHALDNGIWDGQTHFERDVPFPPWFNSTAGRRRFAAGTIREAVRHVASSRRWEMSDDEFGEIVDRHGLNAHLIEIAPTLPMSKSDRRILSVTVSPFPEDQLFYLVLNAASRHSRKIEFEQLKAPWANRNTLDADCTLINELALPGPAKAVSDSSHNIFLHEGYYVFANKPTLPHSTPEQRAELIMDLGFERYQRGEYPELARSLGMKIPRSDLRENRKPLPAAPQWAEDFESFIAGGDHIYVGGSINSRLLIRLWQGTGRIHTVFLPDDFRSLLKRMPANRLILGPAFRERLGPSKVKKLLPKLVELYKCVGQFLHNTARRAAQGDEESRRTVRHFMQTLALGADQHKDGIWNFVVSEDDMLTLILNDNNFVPAENAWPHTISPASITQ